MKRFLVFWMMVWLLGPGTARAGEVLTLEEAIVAALENNIDLNQNQTQVATAEVQVKKEKADTYPDLTLSVDSVERFDASTHQRAIWQSREARTDFLGAKAVSTLTLFNGFHDTASLDRARFEMAAAKDTYSRSRQSVIFETISRFVTVVLNQQLIKVEKRNLEVNQQQLERVDSFYKAGIRPINDLYQQRARTSQAELKVLDARHNVEVSKLMLSQIMGNAGDTGYDVREPDMLITEKDKAVGDATPSLSKALEKRTDISAQEKRIMAAMEKIDESKAGYWPQVSLSTSVGTSYTNLLDTYGFSDQFMEENPYAAVGLNVSIPIFDRRRTSSQLAQARIQLRSEKLKLADMKQQVELEMRKAILDYNTATLQLEVAKKQIESAFLNFVSTKERYDLGSSDLVALSQAMDQFAEASYEEIKAKYNHLLAMLGMAYYRGDLEKRLAEWKIKSQTTLLDDATQDEEP